MNLINGKVVVKETRAGIQTADRRLHADPLRFRKEIFDPETPL